MIEGLPMRNRFCTRRQRGFNDVAYLDLRFEGDVTAHLHLSWLSPVKVRRMIFAGTKTSIIYDDLEASEKIKVYDHGVMFDVTDIEMRNAAAQPSVLANSVSMWEAFSMPGNACSTKRLVSSKSKRSADASISSRSSPALSLASGSDGSVRLQRTTCTCGGAFSIKNDIASCTTGRLTR